MEAVQRPEVRAEDRTEEKARYEKSRQPKWYLSGSLTVRADHVNMTVGVDAHHAETGSSSHLGAVREPAYQAQRFEAPYQPATSQGAGFTHPASGRDGVGT